jgi:hypothetical protein
MKGGANRPSIIGRKHSVYINIIDSFGGYNAGIITGRNGGADRPSTIGRKHNFYITIIDSFGGLNPGSILGR